MKPVHLEIVTRLITTFEHCRSCDLLFNKAGLDHKFLQSDVEGFPPDLKEEFIKLSDWLRELTRLYKHRLLIKLIDVQSPLGIYKSLRYRIRTYPTFIVEGKETYSGWDKNQLENLVNASKQTFKLDAKNGKMTFSAKNVDLTGLSCPITVTMTIGSYTAKLDISEAIVNGPNKPCPIQLMQGVKNSLEITKAPSFKKGKTAGTDSLTVSGTFTVDGNYKKAPLTITVGGQTFTVPVEQMGDNSAAKIASCKPATKTGPQISAKLDYNKCTFTISTKNANITQSGSVPFGISCFAVSLQGLETIELITK